MLFHKIPTSGVMNKVDSSSSSCNKNGCCSDQTSSSSSSSIGKNSDLSEDGLSGKLGDAEEVQSKCKGGPLDAMDSLEEVLPIRRGISRFYNGKSKTFASLIDASLSSVKEIVKPNNAYTRRQRNLLARSLKGIGSGGGISKRVTGSGRSTLGLAMVMNSSESDFNGNVLSSWRSYSLSHLQQQCVPGGVGVGVGVSCSNLNEKPT